MAPRGATGTGLGDREGIALGAVMGPALEVGLTVAVGVAAVMGPALEVGLTVGVALEGRAGVAIELGVPSSSPLGPALWVTATHESTTLAQLAIRTSRAPGVAQARIGRRVTIRHGTPPPEPGDAGDIAMSLIRAYVPHIEHRAGFATLTRR
jgi:hypothetical protein